MKLYKKALLPAGFQANALSCGIKKSGKPDLAIFYSQVPARASCKFTSNKIIAAPIQVNKRNLKNNRAFQAVIVNSGNANCFTGKPGVRVAQDTAKAAARNLKIKSEDVLLASTGIIGKPLAFEKIKVALPELVRGLSKQGIDKAKQAIMTTDTFTKEITAKFNIGNKNITICGVAKGAGMIAPNMATMLAFIFTDASITQQALNLALGASVDNSFNCITVDGCMSTNDSVILLANGLADNALIEQSKNYEPFLNALGKVCGGLAEMIIKDAEGASKFIRIKVKGAKSFIEARAVGLAIANSSLFKTAMYGENPNFGRIVAAVGASGIDVKEEELKIKTSPLNKKEINVDVSIKRGSGSCVVYTSDLTGEYIKINAKYN